MKFKQYYKEAKEQFVIPEKIQKNFEITGDMSNAKNWKAKILAANSATKGQKIGQLDQVRYILIGLKTNNIIPIAIADEHRTGYDLLQEYYYKKKLVPKDDYISVCSWGNDYFYPQDQEYTKQKLEAYKKFIAYGGKKLTVNAMGGDYQDTIQNFIKRGADISVKKGELATKGQNIVNRLEKIAKLYKQSLEPLRGDKFIKKLNDAALAFLDDDDIGYELRLHLNIDGDYMKKLRDDIMKNLESNEAVGKGFFGMNGIKNTIHNYLRKFIKDNQNYPSKNDYKRVFGDDLELAYREFNRLGEI